MKLILVHGRAQAGKDPAGLQREWLAALNRGLAKSGLVLPPDLAVAFPFYGDRLDELLRELDTPLVEDIMLRGAPPDSTEASFRGELLVEIAHAAGITDQEIIAHYAGQPRERGPANWAWVQAILRSLDQTPMGEGAIDAFTRDVYVYLTNANVRRIIDRIVAEAFTPGQCVVVGHSLGSVVAYNVLRKLKAASPVARYVTVGSPLGIKAVRKWLDAPLAMPGTTAAWSNARDPRDVVALFPLDRANFGITPPIENKSDVTNHTDNRHGIDGYLDDPAVARWIDAALSNRP